MSQTLLDGTAETVDIQTRLDFIRKMEDSQTPIVMIDTFGVKHLLFVTKVTYARPWNPLDHQEEPEVTLSCVDAYDGLWLQIEEMGLLAEVDYDTLPNTQSNFVWAPAAADTFNWDAGVWMPV